MGRVRIGPPAMGRGEVQERDHPVLPRGQGSNGQLREALRELRCCAWRAHGRSQQR